MVNRTAHLPILGTRIIEVDFIEAFRCDPDHPGPWHPAEPVRQHCRQFLETHLIVTEPRLDLPLGLAAAASCMEVAFAQTPAPLEAVVGIPRDWLAPWGPCWILPLYHPSPANGTHWPRNKLYLRRFLKECPEPALRVIDP